MLVPPDENRSSPVFGFMKNPTMVDYPGKLAAVFFVSGCNFRCGFCHNAGLMARHREGITWARLRAACRNFADNWVDAAVISGGEPTLHPELASCIERLKSFGWAVKLDTNGSQPEVLDALLPQLDYVAMDVKAGFSRYGELTGWRDVSAVHRSIGLIRDNAADYEFRTTVIEGFHTLEQMREIGAALRGARRWVLQPFLPREDLPDPALRNRPRTSAETLAGLQAALADTADRVLIRGADES